MPKIHLITEIHATCEICFDLSRSIDLHKISTAHTKEEAIAGRTEGLISLNETVTWQATHFGFRQQLTSKITAFERPNYFIDEQVKGIFKLFVHQHCFEKVGDNVLMKDTLEFTSPFGIIGKLFNKIVLTNYLKKFLTDRNKVIKDFAESGKWREVIIPPMKHIILLLQLFLLTSLNLFGQDFERYKTLVDTTIRSEHLGFNKNISITFPVEWQKDLDRDFPLIIIFDRQNQRSHDYMLYTIDYLTSNEQMPASILVSIASEEQYRYLETLHKATTNDGLAEENEKFLFEELIPLLETHYKTSQFRLFIGHSRYGYFTTALLNSRITELNGVIALSPFFTQKNVDLTDTIGRLDDKVLESHKYYYFGIGKDYPSDFFKMDSIIKKLTNPHLSTEGFFFKEADHNVTPGLTISSSLYKLFEVWSKNQSLYLSNEQTDLSIINALKNAIQSHYGSSLELSLGVLNGKGWFFYNEGEYNKAIEAWEIVLETYPNFSEAYLYIIAAQIQLKKDYNQTVDRFKNSLNSSLIYSEVEKQELVEELANLIQ